MKPVEKKPFLPIILGTDINAYTMSISFHEKYGIKPVLVGRMAMAFTEGSSVIEKIHYVDNIEDGPQYANELHQIAAHYKQEYENLILIGTNDFYVTFIIKNRDQLGRDFVFNYINQDWLQKIYLKKNFYELCAKHGIDTPLTYFYDCSKAEPFDEDTPFPLIVKPSNGVAYYNHPFENMQKVYKVENKKELNTVLSTIKASGYQDDLIIQDYIPGDDTYMWDAVYYATQEGTPQLISFAQVALQEHTKTGVGNYTALIVRHNKEFMEKLVGFMKAIGYTGFANFDIKYDERDGTFKVFEVNVRQGRSSYYLTQCGHNLAEFLVDDLIYQKEKPMTYLKGTQLFSVVPKGVLKRYIADPVVLAEAKDLIKNGHYGNPLFYKHDTGFKRRVLMMLRQLNYFNKYKHSEWKQ